MKNKILIMIGSFFFSMVNTTEKLSKYTIDPREYPYTIFFQEAGSPFESKMLVPGSIAEEVKEILADNILDDPDEGEIQVSVFQNGTLMQAITIGWINADVVNALLLLNKESESYQAHPPHKE